MRAETLTVHDDPALLACLLADAAKQPERYQPGVYWRPKAQIIVAELRRSGIANFRSDVSTAGLSFTDAPMLDARRLLGRGLVRRALRAIIARGPLGHWFDTQVAWTRSYAEEVRVLRARCLVQEPRVGALLERYNIPVSTAGGCVDTVTLGKVTISTHYLCLLDQLDVVAGQVALDRVRTVAEIGGGFGTNVHLLLTNFPNIRKVLYCDMVPPLYIGTQYLRAHFGDAVLDYQSHRTSDRIAFNTSDDLEIVCIAPWQLPQFASSVDLFWNAHSFVEMPRSIAQHYAEIVMRFPAADRMSRVLISYDRLDGVTLTADDLPNLFPDPASFTTVTRPHLWRSDVPYRFHVSLGAFTRWE